MPGKRHAGNVREASDKLTAAGDARSIGREASRHAQANIKEPKGACECVLIWELR